MRYLRPVAAAVLLALAACSGNDVKTTLGLDRGAPDEFRVVSRPPLSVPPQFDLRPPSDGASSQLATSAQAQELLIGGADAKAAPAPHPANAAESAFLKEAGAAHADPKVRQKIVEDQLAAQQQQPDDTSWWNFWSSPNPAKKEPVVNANKEAQRIKTDEDSGQPVTAGETPVVKPKDTGLLGQILGY